MNEKNMVSSKLMSSAEHDVTSQCATSSASNVLDTNFKIGMRVSAGDDNGTVCYVGELTGYPGLWLGIDWDNPTRGKHNGTIDGKTYFAAKYEGSGSFLRANKVNTGISVIEALRKKYGEITDKEEERLRQENLEYVSKCINAPFLELVGFDKLEKQQSDFKRLKIVGLRGMHINDGGDLKELARMCPNMHELDLSKNLLTSWCIVFDICSDLHYLRRLNISENKLALPQTIPTAILSQLKIVSCGEMNLTWNDIVYLSEAWPNIEELRAPFNNITHLNSKLNITRVFKHLKVLYLQNNPIKSWHEVNKLGVLESLEKLVLTECSLKQIEFPNCKGKTTLFRNLQCLSVTENSIDNWKSISELDKLENLTELRITKNPIDESESLASCFQYIIARIGNLKNLNGTILLPEDRRGAEYDYMKKYVTEWIDSQKDKEKLNLFLEKHPRYPDLVKKYGVPEQFVNKTSTNLRSNLIEIEIIHQNTIIKKQLPPGMLVQKLITLVQRLLKLNSSLKLYYVSAKESTKCERKMDNEMKDLNFYSLQSGDQIIVRTE